jgi:hypothetical protein
MKKLVIAGAVGLVVIGSVFVLKTSGDDSRRQGSLGEGREAVALSWRGDWQEEAEYAAGNVVSLDGASYVAESEKLAKPQVDCKDCGWTQLAVQGVPTEPEESTAAKPTGYEIVTGQLAIPAGSSTGKTTVNCPAGKKALGGGGYAVAIEFDGPVGPGTPFPNGGVYGWQFGAVYSGGGATFVVAVTCADLG